MKKLLLLFASLGAIFMARAQSVPGDTITYQDFEKGLGDWYNTWGGSIHVIGNPFSTPENSSDSVIYMNADAWSGALIEFQDEDFMITKEIYAVQLDVFAVKEIGPIKLFMDNSASNTVDSYSEISDDVDPGTWQTVTFLTTNLPAYDFQQVAFQPGIPGTVYLDNVRLVKKSVVTEILTLNESHTFSVFPNPATSSIHFGQIVQELSIYNALGEEIKAEQNVSKLDVSGWQKGIYVIKTELGTSTFSVQ